MNIENDEDIRSLNDGGIFSFRISGDGKEQPLYFFFNLLFEDSIGNKYIQYFSFFADELTQSAPRLINDSKWLS
ncbi:hypothetical protein EON78_00040 [bacterium]|nr:MAG: hypothetical protein EON78_00040 [bacterium]